MSFGLHRVWKKQFVKNTNIKDKSKILDLASGTGDIAKLIYEHSPSSNIWLVDQNKEMILKALSIISLFWSTNQIFDEGECS